MIRRWILAAAVLPLVITATPPPMPIGLYQSGFGYTTAWTTGTFPVVPKIALYYSGWGYPFQAGWARIAWAHGAEVKVDMQTGYNGTTLRQVTQGASDPFLRAFAGQIRAFGHPVIVSFDQEMNGGWYSWGKQPYWYVRAYRHVYGVMHPIAPGIRFSWDANINGPGVDDLARYWPGAAYVNIAGLDGYFWDGAATWGSVFGPSVAEVRRITNRPLWIAETGVRTYGRRVAQIRSLFAGARASGVGAIIYFDDGSWRLEGWPLAEAEFARLAG